MLQNAVDQLPRFATYYNAVFLFNALLTTFLLTAAGCLFGLIVGFWAAVLRRTRGWILAPLRGVAIAVIELFRRIPFLVTLLIVFYAFQMTAVEVSVFTVAVVSVCLIATAYISEIVRAGLDSVHPNQWDSAAVNNFSLLQTLRWVVIPQAWKVILPPSFSFFLLFVKDSALASQIGVVELTYAGKILNNKGFSPILSFGAILILYFVLSYPLALAGKRMENRLARPAHR
jgi:polar amino acid transport system permease protein